MYRLGGQAPDQVQRRSGKAALLDEHRSQLAEQAKAVGAGFNPDGSAAQTLA